MTNSPVHWPKPQGPHRSGSTGGDCVDEARVVELEAQLRELRVENDNMKASAVLESVYGVNLDAETGISVAWSMSGSLKRRICEL